MIIIGALPSTFRRCVYEAVLGRLCGLAGGRAAGGDAPPGGEDIQNASYIDKAK